MASITKQAGPEKKVSKKQFSETVFARLTGSLADFNLKEKKLQTRLKKVSKRLAADILKSNKAEAKDKAQEMKEEKVVDIKSKKTKDKIV
jgi:tyrosyl-tRNA synthetase